MIEGIDVSINGIKPGVSKTKICPGCNKAKTIHQFEKQANGRCAK